MITAHLPAGYITGRAFARSGPILWAALLGGIFPDLDLIWFYFIDNRALHHHHYWVHVPAFWATLAGVSLPIIACRVRRFLPAVLGFFAAIALHLVLDTLAGDIKWLWPWSDDMVSLISVPASHPHWILNFILHPVFVAELAIWAVALFLWRRTKLEES